MKEVILVVLAFFIGGLSCKIQSFYWLYPLLLVNKNPFSSKIKVCGFVLGIMVILVFGFFFGSMIFFIKSPYGYFGKVVMVLMILLTLLQEEKTLFYFSSLIKGKKKKEKILWGFTFAFDIMGLGSLPLVVFLVCFSSQQKALLWVGSVFLAGMVGWLICFMVFGRRSLEKSPYNHKIKKNNYERWILFFCMLLGAVI